MENDDRLGTRSHAPSTAERAAELMRQAMRGKTTIATRERLEVFVLRASGKAYMWEIRRNGSTVVSESAVTFASPALARSAGEVAYMAMLS